jgi:tetratricopeptide (TPR) repeat protein
MAISYGRSFNQARAVHNRRLTPARSRQMQQLLQQAGGEKDALLAIRIICDYLNHWNDVGPAEVAAAESAVNAALRLDPAPYLAHYALGFLERTKGRHRRSLAAFEATIRSNPDFARAHAQRGEALLYLGRAAEATAAVDEAIRRNPTSNIRGYFYWVKGHSYLYQQQYAEAIHWLELSVRNWPNVWYNRAYLVSAHALSGEPGGRAAARRVLRAFNRRFPGYTVAQVIENEGVAPDDIRSFIAMRQRLHEGLRLAGMSS